MLSNKAIFLPDFIFEANKELKKFEIYSNFIKFEDFIKYFKNKNTSKKIINNDINLDKKIYDELNLKKYNISLSELQENSDKNLREISKYYDPKFLKDNNLKSISAKTYGTFILQFIKNTYSEENIENYLINIDKLKKDYLFYKNYFKFKFKFDLTINLFVFINNIIKNNESKYNILINKINSTGKRPRNLNNILQMINVDNKNYLERLKFYYNRELEDINLKLKIINSKNRKSINLLINLKNEIKEQINFIDSKIDIFDKIKKRLHRNIFLKTIDKIPRIKKFKLKIGGSIDEKPKGELELDVEFKD